MVYVFHLIAPVMASTATTLPLALQQGMAGLATAPSSDEATPVYTTPPTTTGEAEMTAKGSIDSSCLFHFNFPLSALIASSHAPSWVPIYNVPFTHAGE